MKLNTNSALRAVVVLMSLAATGSASTILQFAIAGAPFGSYTSPNGTMSIASITETAPNFSQTFTFTAGDYLAVAFNTSTKTLSISTTGTSTLAGVAASTAFFSATTGLTYTVTSASPVNITVNDPTIATGALAAFLDDVGLASNATFLVSGGFPGISGSTISSDSLTLTSALNATPEPASMLLSASGLLILALFTVSKRKSTIS